jgi:hypothetical protein
VSTVGTYRMAWTPGDLPADVVAEAIAQLYDQAADLGYQIAGPVTLELVARVPVGLHDDGPDDARPWESRDGLAAEMFDRIAA